MELQKMFELQRILDQRIEQEHGLTERDLFHDKMLALLVEIGELANETRCFKFWSEKGPAPKEVILEEFVDGVHFILSLGIVLGFDQNKPQTQKRIQQNRNTLTEQFLDVFKQANALHTTRSEEDFWILFHGFFDLGTLLGFSQEEIFRAYLKKNEINHQRQDEGY